jgi:hypothetical protein
MAEQPTGTVTLVFTDIERSTASLQRLDRDRYSDALDLHRRLLREAFAKVKNPTYWRRDTALVLGAARSPGVAQPRLVHTVVLLRVAATRCGCCTEATSADDHGRSPREQKDCLCAIEDQVRLLAC